MMKTILIQCFRFHKVSAFSYLFNSSFFVQPIDKELQNDYDTIGHGGGRGKHE